MSAARWREDNALEVFRTHATRVNGREAVPLYEVYALYGYGAAQTVRLLEAAEPGVYMIDMGNCCEYVTEKGFCYAASSAAEK